MNLHASVIPIRLVPAAPAGATPAQAAPAEAGCGACAHSALGPVCRLEARPPTGSPRLSGPTEQLEAVLAALRHDLTLVQPELHDAAPQGSGQPPALTLDALIHSLHLSPGEADLVLAVAPRCGGARLAEAAFQTLRRLLPDTDIYVRHAA